MATAKKKAQEVYSKKKATLTTEETTAAKMQRERVQELLAKAAEKNQETVVKNLAQLKVSITNALDSIGNQLSAEITTLKEVQEAIAAEKTNLELLHGITAEANSLQTLLAAQEEERAHFDEERQAFHDEMEEAELVAETTRKRSEEQYAYDWQKKCRDEVDQHRAKLHADETRLATHYNDFNVKLTAREKAVAEKEAEFNALRDQLAKAEENTKAQVNQQVAIATSALKRDLTHTHELEKMKLENQLNLKHTEVTTLNAHVQELLKRNQELDAKYKEASDKVQQIAEKAIESASKQAVVVQHTSNPETSGDIRRK